MLDSPVYGALRAEYTLGSPQDVAYYTPTPGLENKPGLEQPKVTYELENTTPGLNKPEATYKHPVSRWKSATEKTFLTLAPGFSRQERALPRLREIIQEHKNEDNEFARKKEAWRVVLKNSSEEVMEEAVTQYLHAKAAVDDQPHVVKYDQATIDREIKKIRADFTAQQTHLQDEKEAQKAAEKAEKAKWARQVVKDRADDHWLLRKQQDAQRKESEQNAEIRAQEDEKRRQNEAAEEKAFRDRQWWIQKKWDANAQDRADDAYTKEQDVKEMIRERYIREPTPFHQRTTPGSRQAKSTSRTANGPDIAAMLGTIL